MNGQRKNLRNFLCAALSLSAILLGAPRSVPAEQIKVDWSDAEIQKFSKERATKPPTTLGISQANRLNNLKLPVLAFDSVPQLVKNTSAHALQLTAPSREILMNETDPTWYQINDQYGDVSISVAASLTVHHEVSKDTIYAPATPSGVSVQNDPQISVFDENGEPGFEGLVIEYTVYKFPDIPYTVTIECTKLAKEKCRDLPVIAKDKDLLTLIVVPPSK
jgi:hypothetical protein